MSKAVGVHPMAIKDIVKDLREENLIEEEKIGASSFYWCLESKIMNNLVAKEKKLQSEIEMLDKEIGIQNQLYEGRPQKFKLLKVAAKNPKPPRRPYCIPRLISTFRLCRKWQSTPYSI